MDFYDGNTLIESLSAEPYTATLTAPAAGEHNLRAVVTDDNGKKGDAFCMVNNATSESSYSLIQTFKVEGCVPQNWSVSNGSSTRVGGGLPYSNGCRILRFTNATRDFEYGLLVQNPTGSEKGAWAKFGDKNARSSMMLHTGRYALRYKLCNWNKAEFTPITIAIENLNGEAVASEVYTPTVNIGGNTGNKFSGVKVQTFEFDIPETGDYVVVFYADAAKNADFVLGLANLQAKSFTETGIKATNALQSGEKGCFDLSGRKITESQVTNGTLKPGLYIIDRHKVVVK
jgi:hypothetical protein